MTYTSLNTSVIPGVGCFLLTVRWQCIRGRVRAEMTSPLERQVKGKVQRSYTLKACCTVLGSSSAYVGVVAPGGKWFSLNTPSGDMKQNRGCGVIFRCVLLFLVPARKCLHALMLIKTQYFSHSIHWCSTSIHPLSAPISFLGVYATKVVTSQHYLSSDTSFKGANSDCRLRNSL